MSAASFRRLDLGRLLLRVLLGALILVHGVNKLIHGIDPIFGMLKGAGLPTMLGYGVYVGEILAPLLLILGLWTRAAAAVVAFNMVVALYLAHMKQFLIVIHNV